MSENKTLPGAPIYIKSVGSTGNHQNAFGVGSIDFSATRNGNYPWLDMGKVYFSSPSPQQLEAADAIPFGSKGDGNKSDIRRRLSFNQAQLVNDVITRAIKLTFNGEIPADDEIDTWRAANGF